MAAVFQPIAPRPAPVAHRGRRSHGCATNLFGDWIEHACHAGDHRARVAALLPPLLDWAIVQRRVRAERRRLPGRRAAPARAGA